MKFYSKWISSILRNTPPLNRLISKLAYLANLTPGPSFEGSAMANPETQNFDFQRRVVELSRLLRVEKVVDPKLRYSRFGNQFDGGYVIVNDFKSTDCLASLGVGNDITFDSQISKLISVVHFYDHTVNELPQNIENAIFYREEIGYVKKGSVTLEEVLLRLNPTEDSVLKMDIEGSEWEVLANTVSLESFKQIVIEFHGLQQLIDLNNFIKMTYALRKLHSTHAPVHLHANNYVPVALIGNCLVPDVIEVTYLNRSQYETVTFDSLPGSELDNPNSTFLPEIALSFPMSSRFDLI